MCGIAKLTTNDVTYFNTVSLNWQVSVTSFTREQYFCLNAHGGGFLL